LIREVATKLPEGSKRRTPPYPLFTRGTKKHSLTLNPSPRLRPGEGNLPESFALNEVLGEGVTK